MLDRYNRRIHYLRISVTDLCNMRCVYCMPPEGVKKAHHVEILSFEEIEEVVRVAVRLGVDKVRLTGGEPLVRRDIIKLIRMLAAIEGISDFAMTTNGALLAGVATELRKAGIMRLNISLDTLDPDRYRLLTRGGELASVLNGIREAKKAGFSRMKLNCVVKVSPDEPDAKAVGIFAKEQHIGVQYIRQMDTATGRFWRVIGGSGGHCEQCNRLRLSSSGLIYPCLFSDLSFSVRELGAERALRSAVDGKPVSGQKSKNQFYAIGG